MSGGCCQGFLVWPPGCGSWCCYEQTQKINLLIQRHYWLDTHSHSQSLLLSLYLLLTFGEMKKPEILSCPIFLAAEGGHKIHFWLRLEEMSADGSENIFSPQKRKKSRSTCLLPLNMTAWGSDVWIWGSHLADMRQKNQVQKQGDGAKGRKTLAQLSHLTHAQSSPPLDLFVHITRKLQYLNHNWK